MRQLNTVLCPNRSPAFNIHSSLSASCKSIPKQNKTESKTKTKQKACCSELITFARRVIVLSCLFLGTRHQRTMVTALSLSSVEFLLCPLVPCLGTRTSQSWKDRRHEILQWVIRSGGRRFNSSFYLLILGTMYQSYWGYRHERVPWSNKKLCSEGWQLILSNNVISALFSEGDSSDLGAGFGTRYNQQIPGPWFHSQTSFP